MAFPAQMILITSPLDFITKPDHTTMDFFILRPYSCPISTSLDFEAVVL